MRRTATPTFIKPPSGSVGVRRAAFPVLPALLLAVLLLPGCASSADEATSSQAAPQATHGDLHGVVVDAGIRPLAGALVQATGSGLKLTTNSSTDGTFRFPGLPLGTYILSAKKVGLLAVQLTSDLNGTSSALRIVLSPDPNYRAPVAVVFKHVGIVQCGAVVSAPPVTQYAAIAVCDEANRASGQPLTEDTSQAVHALDPGTPKFVQSELAFTADQATTHQLLLYDDALERGGTKYVELGSNAGPSPVVVSLLEGRTGKLGQGADLQIRVFPWYDAPTPAGATFQQRFEAVSVLFYGYAPPAGWLYSRDGVPAPPK
jgi:hypothetical protein